MPTYVFRCKDGCGAVVELVRPMREACDPALCGDCDLPMLQELQPAHITPDITPYIATAGDRAGKPVTSRKAHREYLKRNRLIEVGNEPIRDTKVMRPTVTRKEIREELRRVVPQVLKRARA